MEELLQELFRELNEIVGEENLRRTQNGTRCLPQSKILLLGQMSLLVDKTVSAQLTLAQTGDMDAKIEMDYFVKMQLKTLLDKRGFIYDEDSDLIFIPKGSKELPLFDFTNIKVERLDPESILVSKALKAPEKNRPLLIEGVASGLFPNIITRIEEGGGDLDAIFKWDEHE